MVAGFIEGWIDVERPLNCNAKEKQRTAGIEQKTTKHYLWCSYN